MTPLEWSEQARPPWTDSSSPQRASRHARPHPPLERFPPHWDRESLGRRAEPRFIPPGVGDETANGSYRECPLHLGGLQLALGTSPVPIDVRGHFQRGVAEMAGQPSDVCTALEAAFRERMPEAVEGPLFLGRSDPWNRRLLHGGVQMAPKKSERRQVALVPTVEYEAGRIVPLPVPP